MKALYNPKGHAVRKVRNLGDDRNKGWCVHCGGPNETRDHAPSVVFLDEPLPSDLPASPSCASCNQGFSNDEAYLACLLECVLAGGVDPSAFGRPKIASLLIHRPSLVRVLRDAYSEVEGSVVFNVDHERVQNVVSKLARCHMAFELNEPRTDPPQVIWFKPLISMDPVERTAFEDVTGSFFGWPEVGSRAMNRLLVEDGEVVSSGWLNIQPGRYRYIVMPDSVATVRIVIREYLACEVIWE